MAKTALVIPAAYHSAKAHTGGLEGGANLTSIPAIISQLDPKLELGLDAGSAHGLKIISRGTAILLLFVYVAYLIFQVSLGSPRGARARERIEC